MANIEVLLKDALAQHSATVYALCFKDCLLSTPSFPCCDDKDAPKKNKFAYAWIPLSNLETVLSKMNNMHLLSPVDRLDPLDERGIVVQIANQYHYRYNHENKEVCRPARRSLASKQQQPKFIGGRRWSASQQETSKRNEPKSSPCFTSQYFKYPQNQSHTDEDVTDQKGWRRSASEDRSRLLDLRNMCVYQRLMNPQDGSIVDRIWKTRRVGPPYKRFLELLSYQDYPTYIEADQQVAQHCLTTLGKSDEPCQLDFTQSHTLEKTLPSYLLD